MSTAPLDLALELHERYNLAPIPIIAGTKQPAIKWKQYQHEGPDTGELQTLFDRPGLDLTVGVLCGEPSDRLLVLDCDNSKTLDHMVNVLGNPQTPIIQTFRGGHIYLRTPQTVKGTRGEGLDVKAQGGYVLAPGAIHPKGVRYAWLNHPKHIYELKSLDAIPGLELKPASTRPETMPQKAWALLTGGHTQRIYNSASEREYAAVCSLVNAGWDFGRILTAFDRFAEIGGHYKRKERESGDTAARLWLKNAYEKAYTFTQTHEREDRRAARELKQWALSIVWPGRTGPQDQAVYVAHATIAENCGQLEYSAGVRTLAEYAGINKDTASNANHRLINKNLIKRVEPATVTRPAIWRLLPPVEGVQKSDTYISPNVRKCRTIAHFAADAFRTNGLGKSAAQIWTLFQDEQARTSQEVSNRTGRCLRTVKHCLVRMHQLGMVFFEIDGKRHVWRVAPAVDLSEIAEKVNTAGAGARQAARHDRERRAHRFELERGRAK